MITVFAILMVSCENMTDTVTPEPESVDISTTSTETETDGTDTFYVSGILDSSKSKTSAKRVNLTNYRYIHEVYITQNNGTSIIIVLPEALSRIVDGEILLEDGDLLVLKLDTLVKPGVWQGVLVENLTKNISFE